MYVFIYTDEEELALRVQVTELAERLIQQGKKEGEGGEGGEGGEEGEEEEEEEEEEGGDV